ncbi:M20 metallopeptidase family protein [Microbacterium sp. No. 7]|uniref:M20 metallopeptidase family protein n=1 Tax=Microbacterium sp. No. 7 TaxID=1714373 RepID=UPI0006D12A52|nr:M20 family metallopeptidase [Microbacterium sp. No. 7]ALJ18404.1 amidohydrolase [Microbacterium sp. No. 7]
MSLASAAESMQNDLADLRKRLHQVPEVGLDLPQTQALVLEALEGLPLEITTGKSLTSVVAVLRGGARDDASPRTVLLRGDMDGLPIVEETGLDWASTNGNMHGCGHDMHTAGLVGAARLLCGIRDELKGDVVFMFQPGEEGWDGAGHMLEEGLLEVSGRKPDAAYAMHAHAFDQTGIFSTRPGPFMFASHALHVTVKGESTHGTMPYRGKDPVVAAAEMITALQVMVTRNFTLFDPVVLSVGMIKGGSTNNTIPPEVTFSCTVRSQTNDTSPQLEKYVDQYLTGIAAAHGVEVDYRFIRQYPATINDADEAAFAEETIRAVLGDEAYTPQVNPITGSEDFSRVLLEVPGAYIGYGASEPGLDAKTAPMNHSPYALFDMAMLSKASLVYAELAARRLERFAREAAGA